MKQLITAGLVVIKDRKLLLAFSKNKRAWYLPGGKIDDGETTLTALIREIKEELDILLVKEELKFYTHVSALAFGEHPEIMMEQDCFLYDFTDTPKPNAEIEDLKYFNSNSYQTEIQVPGVVLLMKKLKEDDLID
ncbi:MAG TPA: NUDIX domain-containing protein [Puia sp.]|jgi:8-oxo-dGTP pyrophosphatase MutT (NUDIX family)|nr:NUDIX domain-containing protein [Puia sp.]